MKKSLIPLLSCSLTIFGCGGTNLAQLKDGQQKFYDGEYAASDARFEEFNQKNTDPTGTDWGAEIQNITLGAGSGEYKPYMMDLLFVSYYQTLDALAMGDFDTARVIINQSYARQQDMSRAYADLIEKSQHEENHGRLPPLPGEQWSAYSTIMNPALTYLAGLYFLNVREYETARTYLSRTAGMVPENNLVAEDLTLASAGKAPHGVEWTFIETGFAPRLKERRFDLPWLIGGKFKTISFAISEPQPQPSSQPPSDAKLLADTDAMFMTEFKAYQVNEVLRAIAKTVADLTLQNTANNQHPLLGLSAMVYSIATTRAETRTWDSLPKRIYLLRKPAKENKLIYIRDGAIKEIKL
jgi:hypothetical protein